MVFILNNTIMVCVYIWYIMIFILDFFGQIGYLYLTCLDKLTLMLEWTNNLF